MIGSHCGKPLVTVTWTQAVFIKRCPVCGKRFTQHKRLPRGPQR